jgi:mono/diheme cytochrome c family protein
MKRALIAILLAGSCGLTVAACGGGGNDNSTSGAASGAATSATAAASSIASTEAAANGSGSTAGNPAGGKPIFISACGGCHTLADARTSGEVGPNLDDLKPDAPTVQKQVENGGGGMPAFKGSLSDADITNVAAYVASVAGQ